MRVPTIWAAMKPGADSGAIPAKLSENIRPIVTAGLANDVELVNQYAAPMYAPTAAADIAARPVRASAKIKVIRPAVATTSQIRWPRVTRSLVANSKGSAVEHHVGQHRAADATDALRHGVEPERRRGNAGASASAQQPISRRHRGIEVCAGDRSEHQDQNRQSEHGGGRILEQLQSDVVRRKLRRCDAGSYNDRNQEGGANELGEQRPIQPLHREPTAARSGPSSSESCCSASDTTR